MSAPARKLLRVNLSTGKTTIEPIDDMVMTDFIGGRGLGIYYLYRELQPATDPLGENNKLLLVTGPLAGTSVQSVSRWMACTKSPLTGAFARSVAGADFGAWLKFAGYDLIIVEGKADNPVYIHITKDKCVINSASDIWGKDTVETQNWITDQHGRNTRIACIGPAGEKLVKYSAIVTGRRTAGRCGTGTVMGSKNLKAIAINTERNLDIHDPATLKILIKEQVETLKANKNYNHHKEMGTTATQDTTNRIGIYPVKNFRNGQLSGYERLAGEEYKKLRTGEFGCYSCAAVCGKMHTVTKGRYTGACSEGPEYESIWAFTAPIDSTSIEASIAADQICDDMGIDTITTGSCIGFAYELYEKGIITRKDTDGLELTYGNHEAMIELVKKIAKREGIGDILAEGSKKAASFLGKGAELYAMHVKGLEMPAYEPRGAKAQGFNYATANVGACHCYGYANQEVFGVPVPRVLDRFTELDKGDIVKFNQDKSAMGETGIACGFSMGWGWFPDLFGKMLTAVTGLEQCSDTKYLWKVGERIYNLERSFNVRDGFSRADDTLPHRLQTEPLHTGEAPGEGQIVRELSGFLDSYYQFRGWSKGGIPSKEKLEELNLSYVVKDITG